MYNWHTYASKEVMTLGQRVGFYLTDLQIQNVKKVSKKTGLTVSEIIRRALDEWLERYEQKPKSKSLILANTRG
jgi:aspartate/methionine/tyrosine aminotransferase